MWEKSHDLINQRQRVENVPSRYRRIKFHFQKWSKLLWNSKSYCPFVVKTRCFQKHSICRRDLVERGLCSTIVRSYQPFLSRFFDIFSFIPFILLFGLFLMWSYKCFYVKIGCLLRWYVESLRAIIMVSCDFFLRISFFWVLLSLEKFWIKPFNTNSSLYLMIFYDDTILSRENIVP